MSHLPIVNFTPGPSQIFYTVEDHIRTAFREGIPSISHRSKTFEHAFQHTTKGLRDLFQIPDGWHIFFVSSATEIWERSIQNMVAGHSHHFVNGAFSSKFHEFSGLLGRVNGKTEAAEGEGFLQALEFPGAELIAVTQNETSTGVRTGNDFIAGIRAKNPEALIIVDGVSSLPHLQPDFKNIDSVFFSVQKGFGMPAGLGVWMVNDRCLEVSGKMASKGHFTGTYHTLQALAANAKKYQTPSTPNILGIWLLGKVCEDFLRRGIDTIRKETVYKSVLLYQTLDKHKLTQPFVTNPVHRSETVVVANTGSETERLTRYLMEHGLQPGDGYGSKKSSQLRFANFPAHSREVYEKLCDLITAFE